MENQETNNNTLNQSINNPIIQPKSHLPVVAMAIFVLVSFSALAFLYYQNQQLKTMLASYQTIPTSSATALATADPTANFQTYIDAEYNFQIKIPNDWKVTPSKKGDVGTTARFDGVIGDEKVYIISGKSGVKNDTESLLGYESNNSKSLGGEPEFLDQKEITVNGLPVLRLIIQLENGDPDKKYGIYYLVANKNDVYFVETFTDNYQSSITLSDQIISTFKFVDEPTADWSTYKDSLFSFKHPREMKIDSRFLESGGYEILIDDGKIVIEVSKNYTMGDAKLFLGEKPTKTVLFGSTPWEEFYIATGYKEPAVGAGNPILAYKNALNNNLITVTFSNQSELTETQKVLLSTFVFLN